MSEGDSAPGHTGRLFLESVRLDLNPLEEELTEARGALEHDVGGFIVFGGEASDVRRLTEELRSEAGRPLWFAADLERGAGQQFAGGSVLPPPQALAAHPEPEEAVRRAATVTAREARGLGINWVLAPVLDLDVEPRNPIVGTRSFGRDPERVARLGCLWIDVCQELGVAACAKHFPGHGRTVADSHTELPAVDVNRDVLESDLLPFRRAAGSVASMMTAHVAYAALEGSGPATLSRPVVHDLLREEMGFEGLLVTDALVMEGLGGGGETATEGWLAVRALRAGCDLLLYPGDLGQSLRTVKQAAEQDEALRSRVAAALEHSRSALERFGGEAADEGMEEDPEAGRLAEACIRSRGAPPATVLGESRAVRLHVLSDDLEAAGPGGEGSDGDGGAVEPPAFGGAFAETLEGLGWRVEGSRGGSGLTARRPADAAAGGEGGGGVRDVVLLAATPRAGKGRALLSRPSLDGIHRALGPEDAGYLIVFGHPRILSQLGGEGACAWSAEPAMARAAARWLHRRVARGEG